jgi:dTDP-4-amino-4,6-dideoxygalactose transaminase
MRHKNIGFNYRMPQLVAFYLNTEMSVLPDNIAIRNNNARLWAQLCDRYGMQYQKSNGKKNNYWSFTAIAQDTMEWEELYKECAKEGTNFYGAWALNYKEAPIKKALHETTKIWLAKQKCPMAENLHDRLIQLPTGGDRTNDMRSFAKALEKVTNCKR